MSNINTFYTTDNNYSVMNDEQLDKYLAKMNSHFETSFYEMYQSDDSTTDNIIYEYQPKKNEKIIRFVALRNTPSFPIQKEDVMDKYGIISYKTNQIYQKRPGMLIPPVSLLIFALLTSSTFFIASLTAVIIRS